MGVKEDARRCQKCGNQWWARRVTKQRTPRWSDDGITITGSAAARSVRLAHRRSEQIREWERWGLCTRCGSQDISTVRDRGFIPTGMADVSGSVQVVAAAFDPAQIPTPAGPGFQPGDRVVINQFGFRGLTGSVDGKGLTGYKVRLDRDDKLVRSLPEHKLTRI